MLQGIGAPGEKDPQLFEKLLFALGPLFLRQSVHCRLDNGVGATSLEHYVFTARRCRRGMRLEERLSCFCLRLIQWQKFDRAAALQGSFTVVNVPKEILDRRQQKGAEPAFLLIDEGVDLVFDQISEKALREVLCIMHAISAATHESVKRRPVSFAKLRERRARSRFSVAASRRDNHAPMGFRKEIAPTTPGSRQNFHVHVVSEAEKEAKPRKK